MSRISVALFGWLVTAIALTDCGGGTSIVSPLRSTSTLPPSSQPTATATATAIATATPTPSPIAMPTATATTTPSATPSAAPPPPGPSSTSSVYLGDIAQGAVLIYSSNANGNVAPSATIAGSNTGFTDGAGTTPIYGVAVDETGTVYVLTQTTDSTQGTVSAETILVFPAGTTGNVAPARSITLPTSIDAESLAYAASDLYVTDDAGSGAVDVYPSSAAGTTMPTRTFTDSTAFPDLPLKVSIDASGNAYVATYDPTATAAAEATQGVYRFPSSASGSVAPSATIAGGNTGFGSGVLDAGIIDPSGRVDAVLDDTATDTTADIDEFADGATGNASPTTAFTDVSSQGPVDAAVDASGNLYVSEIADSTSYAQVNVFASGATTPKQTLLAYEGVLPLIALGPYVAPASSGSMPIGSQRRATRSQTLTRWRHRFAHSWRHEAAGGFASRYRP